MGGGIYGLDGWASYDLVSSCFVWKYAQKMLVFRGVPYPIITWPQVSVPLNSWPVAYYRKGGTTPHLRLAFIWRAQFSVWFHNVYELNVWILHISWEPVTDLLTFPFVDLRICWPSDLLTFGLLTLYQQTLDWVKAQVIGHCRWWNSKDVLWASLLLLNTVFVLQRIMKVHWTIYMC